MKISNLQSNPKNPRIISSQALASLKNSTLKILLSFAIVVVVICTDI
jgi:hypothetical protein